MTHWKSFGASVRGPGHISTAKPNQDAWTAFHHIWGDGIVVSDGLGSKLYSNFGSERVCDAVVDAVSASRYMEMSYNFLTERIKTNWLSRIAPLEPRNCAATCLYAFRFGDGVIHLGMLGDGLISVIRFDGSVTSLSDDKSQGFSNVTAALSPNTSAKDWRHLSLPEEECTAILLCTDGVSDDLDNVEGFVVGFVEAHRNLTVTSANQRTREMLENWTTPKHSDDKTIACLCRDERILLNSSNEKTLPNLVNSRNNKDIGSV